MGSNAGAVGEGKRQDVTVSGDRLMLNDKPLRVIVSREWIHVGCHRISRNAWIALREMVDHD